MTRSKPNEGKSRQFAAKANQQVLSSEFLDKEFTSLFTKHENASINDNDYVTHIIHKQKVPYEIRLWNSMKVTFTSAPTILYVGGGLVDHVTTYTRSFQVYSNLWANFTYTGANGVDAQNPLSAYYQLLTVNGESTALTDAGWAAFALGIVALPLGMGREVYRMYRKNTVAGLDYHKRRLKEIGVTYAHDEDFYEEIEECYKEFLDKGKVVNRLKKKPLYENARAIQKANYQNETLNRVVGLFGGKFNIKERNALLEFLGADFEFSEQETNRSWIEITIAVIVLAAKKIWDPVNDLGYKYWLVWFAFASVIGVTAASASVFYAPIVFGITLALGGLYILPKIIGWVQDSGKENEELIKENKANELRDELDRMAAELKYRHFMKREHHQFKHYFLQELNVKPEVKIKKEYDRKAVPEILSRSKKKVMDSKLAKYLLKGSDARRGIAVATDVATGIILTSFAFWVVSAGVFAFVGVAIPLVLFLESALSSGIAGLVIGGLYGIRKYAEMKQAQLNYEQRIHKKLSERFKGTDETKGEAFERLEKEVEFECAKAEWKRLRLILVRRDKFPPAIYANAIAFQNKYNQIFTQPRDEKNNANQYKNIYKLIRDERTRLETNFDKNEMNEVIVNRYDLDKIDVYNHEYREKQRHQAGVWTKCKRFGNLALTILGGGQTGSLLARTLFGFVVAALTAGGVTVSAMTGTLPIFLGVAAVVTIAYAAVSYYQDKLERERKHQENFLDNLDGSISYLNKKLKEVKLLNKYLDARLYPEVKKQPENQKLVEHKLAKNDHGKGLLAKFSVTNNARPVENNKSLAGVSSSLQKGHC